MRQFMNNTLHNNVNENDIVLLISENLLYIFSSDNHLHASLIRSIISIIYIYSVSICVSHYIIIMSPSIPINVFYIFLNGIS